MCYFSSYGSPVTVYVFSLLLPLFLVPQSSRCLSARGCHTSSSTALGSSASRHRWPPNVSPFPTKAAGAVLSHNDDFRAYITAGPVWMKTPTAYYVMYAAGYDQNLDSSVVRRSWSDVGGAGDQQTILYAMTEGRPADL